MAIVEITSDLSLNTDYIASVALDHRYYMNGSDTYLVIDMADGKRHRISRHAADVFALEKKLKEAT